MVVGFIFPKDWAYTVFDSHQQVVIPSDPQYASSVMPLNLEGLADLWEHTLGDPGITIAILDGPCDTTHPSLAQASLTQWIL